MYEPKSEQERQHAQQQLFALQASPEGIQQCQYLLDQSNSTYALMVASTSLNTLVAQHWNRFTVAHRVDMRNYLLHFLAQKGPQMEDYVVGSLVALVCRITKFGWFDDSAHREIADEVSKFLTAGTDHLLIGLRIYWQLVETIDIPSTERTLTQHRKTAISFRDTTMLRIFRSGLRTLSNLHGGATQGSPAQLARVSQMALKVVTKCLNFDFIGTNPDESSEDIGTIQVPTSWRPVITDVSTMQVLFDEYKRHEPPNSSQAIEAVILISSVRRSIFPGDKARSEFLGQLMLNVRDILANQIGLQHQDNYHHICRLLGRVKCNFQLAELVRNDGYIDWLEHCSQLTIRSFQNWQWSTVSLHYLLALWARMVAAVPYVRNDQGAQNHKQRLETAVRAVVQTYVSSMVEGVPRVLAPDSCIENPLEDAVLIREQMERLPILVRFQYNELGNYILGIFEPLVASYQSAMTLADNQLQANSMVAQDLQAQIDVIEGKLTWLVHMCAALVGAFQWSEATRDGEETMDANISRQVLQLCRGIDYRLNNTNGAGRPDYKLELAILGFLEAFRKVYIWENHSLYSLASAGESRVGTQKISETNMKQRVFETVFESMQMGSHSEVVELLVRKLAGNLKYWGSENDIIQRSLSLLSDMASGYSSSKLLISLDIVQYIITNHGSDAFPFLAHPTNLRHRTTFHFALSRLFLGTQEDPRPTFERFMEPLLNMLAQLSGTTDLRTEDARMAIIGVCRDLRGVAQATHNKRSYGLLFEVLYPAHFPVFQRAVETWFDDLQVVTSVLKFLAEFVHNKSQRLVFDNTSADGILLFRETSAVLCGYGKNLVSVEPGNDPYREKYKGIAMFLTVLSNALSGNYVNFGVFALYHDKALDNAMETALLLVMPLPVEHLFSFPKLAKAYFTFFEIIFQNHLPMLMNLDHPSWTRIFMILNEGLQSSTVQITQQAAASIDHLATFYFENRSRDKPAVRAFVAHTNASPDILFEVTGTLFNQLLFGSKATHWAVIKPILSIMLAVPETFERFKESLLNTQTAENQQKLMEAIRKLTDNISPNLCVPNRDRFAQRLSIFRVDVRSFLSL